MEAEVPVSARSLGARYRLGELLGRGGMAEVYDGYDERLHRPVAVKLLRPDMAADPEVRTRFEVEARSAARLSHPNVVSVFDTGEDDGTPYIVMERLPGETLADRMAVGPVDERWLRRVAGDVLGALGAAHAAGLVHRDVKPGNILVAQDGCAKVADFGIAKSIEVASDMTGTGLLVGTPAYLAPERLDGHPATERSDLYSLAVVLYEALAGTKPFEGPTSLATANAVLHDAPRPLAELRPDVDPALAAAVERAMAKDPAARPASAGEMARELTVVPSTASPDPTVALAGAAAGVPDPTLIGAPPVAAPVRPGASAPRSRPRPPVPLAVLGVAAVVLLVLLIALFNGRGSGGTDGAGLAVAIRDLSGRVQQGDGSKGPEAAERLERIADQVEAGGGADEANTLLRDAAQWNATGQLSGAATEEMAVVLGKIEGVDPAAATTTTAAPTTTTTAPPVQPPPPDQPDDDEDDGKGKGKGRGD